MKRLLLLIPVILIIGCGLFGSKDYFPLAVDNVWKYSGHYYSAADSSTFISEGKITAENAGVFTVVTTSTNYAFHPLADTTTDTATAYIKNANDTIWFFNATDTMILTILPFELDKTWNVITGDTINADTAVYTVKTQEDVTVPADTYKKCWKLEIKHGTMTQNFWFADGVGIVKQSWTGYLRELTEATIK